VTGAPAAIEAMRRPLHELPSVLSLPALEGAGFDAEVRPPGSKSLTNRAMLLAALARGRSTVRGGLRDGDDAVQMLAALRTLGATITERDDAVEVDGVDGRWRVPDGGVTLGLNNAGTATRFLAGATLLAPAPVTIDGNARMRQRPIGELGDILERLGCTVEYLGEPGCPPLRITPPLENARSASAVEVGATKSGQFLSALLLAGPWLPGGITLRLTAGATSASYVSMTLGLLTRLGAEVRTSDDLRVLRVGPPDGGRGLAAFDHEIEPDASGATYFWAAAAIVPGGRCRVPGLDEASLQGDAAFPETLARMGVRVVRHGAPDASIGTVGPRALRPILADMSDMPDAAMTLAAVAAFAGGTSILRGLGTLRVKESDRIDAMRTELAKIGVEVRSPVAGDPDAMTITPPTGGLDLSDAAPPVVFDTYDDHRIAMSLAIVSLRRPNVSVRDPACVGKTYPGFWRDLASLHGHA